MTGALIALLVIYILRSIEKPVKDIVETTRRVSNGDLDVRLNYKSEDEIGVLTDSMNALIERLNDIIKDEKHLLHEIGNENYHCLLYTSSDTSSQSPPWIVRPSGTEPLSK